MEKESSKVQDNVFDRKTIENIEKLSARHIFDEMQFTISSGKEANIYAAIRGDKEKVIIKIYRIQSCNFNKMFDYLKKDIRFTGLRKQRRKIIYEWTRREYRNLMKARELGVRVPTPMEVLDNIIILEYLGDGDPAPQLKDINMKHMEDAQKRRLLEDIAENMRLLHKGGLVHGDLSSFNILIYGDRPYFIDFSQSTLKNNIEYKELLERDIKNVSAFFVRSGLENSEEVLRDIIFRQSS